jgi:hypothetical protein
VAEPEELELGSSKATGFLQSPEGDLDLEGARLWGLQGQYIGLVHIGSDTPME